MKKLFPILIGLGLTGFSAMSRAENLLQVYQQARISNPDLRKSAADRDAAFEKINEARSPLLPQLGLGADYTYTSGFRDYKNQNSNVTSGSLQLTQTLFDMSKWRALTLQEKAAGIQDVTYQTDQQTLILNTATAYFKVPPLSIRSPIPKHRNRLSIVSWTKPPSALTWAWLPSPTYKTPARNTTPCWQMK